MSRWCCCSQRGYWRHAGQRRGSGHRARTPRRELRRRATEWRRARGTLRCRRAGRAREQLHALLADLPERRPSVLRLHALAFAVGSTTLLAAWWLTRDDTPLPTDEGAGYYWAIWVVLACGRAARCRPHTARARRSSTSSRKATRTRRSPPRWASASARHATHVEPRTAQAGRQLAHAGGAAREPGGQPLILRYRHSHDRPAARLLRAPARRGRPRGRRGHRPRARAPAAHAGDDRLRELRAAGGARVPGQRAHEQVRRGLSRQALLRRLRVHRRDRAARDRPREGAVRGRARERPAARRRAGQHGRLPRAAAAGRPHHGAVAPARRPPHATA